MHSLQRRHAAGSRSFGLIFFGILGALAASGVPFTLQGPGVNAADFRVTTFASGLDFPLGMVELSDGSLLVTMVENSNFFSGSSPGKLVRFTDVDGNGIADDAGTVLYRNLPPTLTSLRMAGDLIFVTGPPYPIQILRKGATPSSPLTLVGRLILSYPSGWTEHQHSELGVRKTPGFNNRYDVFFQVGAESNFLSAGRTVALTNENISGASGMLAGDAIHRITIIDDGTALSATNLTQIASGTRNPAGFAFHPTTGDFYFADNGIDGLVDPNEPLSADELNFIARADIGVTPKFFGFPTNYTEYRTKSVVGGAGVAPLIAFQPVADSFTGRESEGPNQITFAPPRFPKGLNTGIFIGFHGKFFLGGINNEENPLVYADPATGAYFHFIAGQQAGVGHLDGLLATSNSLFVADLATHGNISAGAGAGVIYQIKALATPTSPITSRDFNGDGTDDIVWQNSVTGERVVWFMDAGTVVGQAHLGIVAPVWQIAGIGDFDGDGKPDINWHNAATGDRVLWFMKGAGVVGQAYLGLVSPDWRISAVGDFNGDGKPDIVWQNTVNGDRLVWFMDGTTIAGQAYLGLVAPTWQIVGCGDFNGDGKSDIVWQNTVTGDRVVWLMNGTSISGQISLGIVAPTWQIAAIGDFDGDGKPDIAWQNTATGDRVLWFMNGTSVAGQAYLGVVAPTWQMR